jgi:uncharacterized repeat protein (TIGR03803 family)
MKKRNPAFCVTTRNLAVAVTAALLLAVSALAQDSEAVPRTVRGSIGRNVRQTFTTLHNFCSQGGSTCSDGASPNAPLIKGADGSFYGTTSYGGPGGVGTIFKITPSGTLTTLHTFCSESDCADGAFPSGGLIQANDGNFYGVTVYGGVLGVGTVFKMTPGGTLTTFYNFCSVLYCDDGSAPNGGLIQAADGNFYGTTTTGGASQPNQIGFGVIFQLTPTGTLTPLYSFCPEGGSTCADGSSPNASMIQGTDGSLYGTTSYGGPGGVGTMFKITTSGTLTTLHTFCSASDCADGAFPSGGLIQAKDGNFYGVTVYGGVLGVGTVFKMTPSGTLTTFYNFCSVLYCDDGSAPDGGLIQAAGGNFYGTTTTGGASQPNQIGNGVVYEITQAGKLTTLHSFDATDGSFPVATLVPYHGSFYGTTKLAGANGSGTLFRLLARP